MSEKVYCKDCVCVEIKGIKENCKYFCHRKAGPAQEVSRYHWCWEGIYRYGDNRIPQDEQWD